jgi:archaemetzincin
MQKFRYLVFFWVATIALALGCERPEKTSQGSHNLHAFAKYDKPLGTPKEGEWLYHHKERGQTLQQYIAQKNIARPSEHQKTLYLQPIGDFDSAQWRIIEQTRTYISLFYALETNILPSISDSLIPPNKQRDNQGQRQFLATYILDKIVIPNKPADALGVMAVTATDLYPRDEWNFVFGLAYPERHVAVSSMQRYCSDASDTLCLGRFVKTCVHEIGHMFSMMHCTHAYCLMNGTNGLHESDQRPQFLCSICLQKMSWCHDFDNLNRLKNLQAFYTKHGFEVEAHNAGVFVKVLESQ